MEAVSTVKGMFNTCSISQRKSKGRGRYATESMPGNLNDIKETRKIASVT